MLLPKMENEEMELPEDGQSVRFKTDSGTWLIGDYIESEKMFYITPNNFFFAHQVINWRPLNEF